MKNRYRVGSFLAVIGTTIMVSPGNVFAANGEALPSVTKKQDPSRCYWLESKITAEGLCGEKLAPDLPLIISEAEQGNTLAAFRLGELYSSGAWGVELDVQKGVEWYRRAAEGGFRLAQIKLGFMYEHGRGVNKDIAQAVYWYEAATELDIDPELEEKIYRLREKSSW